MSEKSLVSYFNFKAKAICVCLLNLPVMIELYSLFFLENKLHFPVLEFGVVIWSLFCCVYLIAMLFSGRLQRISLKTEIEIFHVRRKIMQLTGLFLLITIIFSSLFIWESKNSENWRQGQKDFESFLIQMEQEKD